MTMATAAIRRKVSLILLALATALVQSAFGFQLSMSSSSSMPSSSSSSSSSKNNGNAESKSSTSAADIANFAVRQSPSTTRFVTNPACPFAQKAWIALEVCGAPYQTETVSLYGRNGKPDWFLELNPDGTVPVLECYGGAVVLPDSDLILNQIADGGVVEGGSVLQAKDEATKELVQEFRNDLALLLPIGKAVVLGDSTRKDELFACLGKMNDKVVGPYLCGEQVTLADCAAFPFLWRLNEQFGSLNADNGDCPKLAAWLAKCMDTKAFSKTVQGSWWWWW